MLRWTLVAATIACGALCGALLGFPLAARFAPLAPLTLFPLFFAYRTRPRRTCAWLTAAFNAAMLVVAMKWAYGGAAAHQGAGEYYLSAIALLFQCLPYAAAGLVAAYVQRLPTPQWCVAIASLWTLCEYWRSTSALGYPYAQLGHALIDTPLVHLASTGGTEILTFTCVLLATALFEMSQRAPRLRMTACVIVAIVVAINATVSEARGTVATRGAGIALFQLGYVNDTTLTRYLRALRTLPGSPAFAVWPESALNLSFGNAMNAIRSAVRARGLPLLAGGSVLSASGYHDALVFIGRDGTVEGSYAKRHLVPFGEFLPLPALARVLIPASIRAAVPNLSPGRGPVVFEMGGRTIGPLICYESAFPGLARDEVRKGATLLVAASNDAWFTGASGVWELEQTARLASIETGTPMIVAGTVGPSGVIDAGGRWTNTVPIGATTRAAFRASPANWTPYDTIGDEPPLATIAILGLLAALIGGNRFRDPSQSQNSR